MPGVMSILKHSSTVAVSAFILLAAAPCPAIEASDLDDLSRRAELGEVEAQHRLGSLYLLGSDRIVPDPAKAYRLLRKAARQGHAGAQNSLASIYETGRAVDRDRVLAATWYLRSALQGNILARHNLALLYNAVEELRYYREAEENLPDNIEVEDYRPAEESEALYRLALMFDFGDGFPLDDALALGLYRLAAEMGHVSASYNLALMFETGQGTEPDYERAVYWYRKAAEQGFAAARHNLALKFARGQGVDRDWALAYTWGSLAADSGDPSSIRNRDLFARELTPEEKADADRDIARLRASSAGGQAAATGN